MRADFGVVGAISWWFLCLAKFKFATHMDGFSDRADTVNKHGSGVLWCTMEEAKRKRKVSSSHETLHYAEDTVTLTRDNATTRVGAEARLAIASFHTAGFVAPSSAYETFAALEGGDKLFAGDCQDRCFEHAV